MRKKLKKMLVRTGWLMEPPYSDGDSRHDLRVIRHVEDHNRQRIRTASLVMATVLVLLMLALSLWLEGAF